MLVQRELVGMHEKDGQHQKWGRALAQPERRRSKVPIEIGYTQSLLVRHAQLGAQLSPKGARCGSGARLRELKQAVFPLPV